MEIFNEAMMNCYGLCKTVRGPVMIFTPGKCQILGIEKINGEKVFVLKFTNCRNMNWSKRIFFAKFDKNATWMEQLKPAFGEKKFFYEDENNLYLKEKKAKWFGENDIDYNYEYKI
jgi:hypothetical protein